MDLDVNGKKNNRIFGILCKAMGWLFTVISIFRYPYILGVAALMFGILNGRAGNRSGMFLIAAGLVSMAFGIMFGDALFDCLKAVAGI